MGTKSSRIEQMQNIDLSLWPCSLVGQSLGGLRCPLCWRTRLCIPVYQYSSLCIPGSDGPDFIVCPPQSCPGWGHTILCQVIACIIIKQPALCRALGEVYWCCGTQFVPNPQGSHHDKTQNCILQTHTYLQPSPTPALNALGKMLWMRKSLPASSHLCPPSNSIAILSQGRCW